MLNAAKLMQVKALKHKRTAISNLMLATRKLMCRGDGAAICQAGVSSVNSTFKNTSRRMRNSI